MTASRYCTGCGEPRSAEICPTCGRETYPYEDIDGGQQ